MKVRCKHCKYWQSDQLRAPRETRELRSRLKDSNISGICHSSEGRNSPFRNWARTLANDWCDEEE